MRITQAIFAIGFAVAGGSAAATATVVVGPPSCSAVATHARYNDITTAIASIPAGSTVLVCPGTYREQLNINKTLTLRGVLDTTNDTDAAIIAIPAGTLSTVADPRGGGPVAAQVLVSNGATATLSNITVDGAGNNLAGCGTDLVGIAFLNSSGSVKNSSVVNQLLAPDLVGCQDGQGIYVASDGAQGLRSVNLSGNNVANFDKNGITAVGATTSVTIDNNSVLGIGATPAIAQNAIQVSFGAQGAVTNNTVGDVAYTGPFYGSSAILVYDSAGINVSNNTISNSQYGVAVVGDGTAGVADGATVTGNSIQGTHQFDAIDLCASSYNTVTKNVIRGSDEAGIHVEGATFCGVPSVGNNVKQNTVNGACAGLLVGPSADGGNTTNTYFNVGTRKLQGADTCTAAAAAAPAGKPARHATVSPSRLPRK